MVRRRSWVRATKVTMVLLLAAGLVAVAPAGPSGADGGDAPGAPQAFRALTAGAEHTCAILQGGTVKCWGKNNFGQLGLNDTLNRGDAAGEMGANLPAVALGAGRTATAVAAGNNHTCALLDNGGVKCWGSNTNGQLGLGNAVNRGDNANEMGDQLPFVDLGTGRTAVSITAGAAMTCALLDNATAKCWGLNLDGQLGQGDAEQRGDEMGEMGDFLPAISLGAGFAVTAISAGGNSACAILDIGLVKCWGNNASGQLGRGNTARQGDDPNEMGNSLAFIELGLGRTVTAVSLGNLHVCAVLDNGAVKCWGENSSGQLGLGDQADRGDELNEMGSSLPEVQVGLGRTVLGVSAGDNFTCARLDSGAAKCWGLNSLGQLGQGDINSRGFAVDQMGDNLSPIQLGTERTATAVATGSGHACARLDNATVKCWGFNTSGQLGQGDVVQRGDAANEMGNNLPAILLGATQPSGLSGTISGSNFTPLAGMFVTALRSNDFAMAGGAVTDLGGSYSIELPPGSYFIYVIDPTDTHATGFATPATIRNVTAATFTDADGTMAPTRGGIYGTIRQDGSGNPIAGAYAISLTQGGALETGVVSSVAGAFTIPNLRAGNHYVAFVDPTGAHAAEFRSDSPTLPGATTVPVSAGVFHLASESLALQPLVPNGGALTGTVTGNGTPLPGVLVVALRASDYRFVRAATTTSNGNYAMSLQNGNYYLAFVDSAGRHHQEWFNNQPNTGLATATAVTSPGVTNADLLTNFGTVGGTVRRASDNQPLPGTWVLAIGPTGLSTGTVAAANGSYTLSGLAPGTYRVTFVDPIGLRPQEYWSEAADYFSATPINVTGGSTQVGVDASLG